MREVTQSRKLADVCYDIRGPVLDEAKRLEDEGHRILKLNIGNPAPFGFEAPDEILVDMIAQLPRRRATATARASSAPAGRSTQYYRLKGVEGVDIEDVYLGNGVSELIVMTHAGDARQRRRGPHPDPGLPAVDRGHLAVRR